MRKILLTHLGFLFAAATVFGQELPQLKVTDKDMTGVIFRYLSDNETVVEVKSNVKLEFESTMDKKVDIHRAFDEAGFYFYELLFPTGKQYDGRKLKIKSYGFDTYTVFLDLKAKTPVGLLVVNDTKRKADELYDAGNFAEALKEYEKLYSINPNYEYVKLRIDQCNERLDRGADKTAVVKLNLIFRGLESKKKASVKLYLDSQLIGETNYSKGSLFKYEDKTPGVHELHVICDKLEWKKIVNTMKQKEFVFEFKNEKTGFGYKTSLDLLQ
jgi:tetratricopeptide (TPR) repeat protein